jgi:aspartate/methionine/tyrosine aminotransferase
MELLRRAKELERQGMDIVHMEIGEPDFNTPPAVLAAAQDALTRFEMKYTQAGGLPHLREVIAHHYRRRYGLHVPSSRIFVTPGASGALLLALAAAMPTGAKVLVADPGYPCYRNYIRLFDGLPEPVDVGRSDYRLSGDAVAGAWDAHTKGIIFASPSNPTGTVMGEAELDELLRLVDERGGFAVSDEIYHGLEYDEHCHTALEFSPRVFVINSFSKYFGMTGWRLGWAVVPEGYEEIAERLAQNLFISTPTLSQWAAADAFAEDNLAELERRRSQFRERRDFLYEELAKLGFSLPARPSGAFYIYADCTDFSTDSYQFCQDLLEQAHVAITPGKDFGIIRPERFVRFAYTRPIDRLAEGVRRIRRFVSE